MGGIQGDFETMAMPDVAIWLANRKMTGKLTLHQGDLLKIFWLEEGSVVRAASSDRREFFGSYLVHFGLLTEDQLERAYETQASTNVLLGRILVMIGIVPEEHVIQTLRVKMSESLLDSFFWRHGSFAFERGIVMDERPEVEVSIPLTGLHREAMRRAPMMEEMAQLLVPGVIVQLNETQVPEDTSPDTLDGKIIALARRGWALEDMGTELRAMEYLVRARIQELYSQGVLSLQAPARSSRPKTSSLNRVPTQDLPTGQGRQDLPSRQGRQDPLNGQARRNTSPVEAAAATASGVAVTLPSQAINPLWADLGTRSEDTNVWRDAVPQLVLDVDPETRERMSAKQRYILARIDGERTIQAILQLSPMQEREAVQIISHLQQQGIVRL